MKRKVDQGEKFGHWDDPVSKFLYKTSTGEIIGQMHIPQSVGDFGGGNGIMKKFIPWSISVDNDASKNPDILDDILYHKKHYELVILRYVLHYLSDTEVIQLFDNINADNILVIQFANPDLLPKYTNSRGEGIKYFRTMEQLEALLPEVKQLNYIKDYIVTKEFYKNRLGIDDALEHTETLLGYYI